MMKRGWCPSLTRPVLRAQHDPRQHLALMILCTNYVLPCGKPSCCCLEKRFLGDSFGTCEKLACVCALLLPLVKRLLQHVAKPPSDERSEPHARHAKIPCALLPASHCAKR